MSYFVLTSLLFTKNVSLSRIMPSVVEERAGFPVIVYS